MLEKEEDCLTGCIEHRQFLNKETEKIVIDFKRDYKFEKGRSLTKSQVVNRILKEWFKLKRV